MTNKPRLLLSLMLVLMVSVALFAAGCGTSGGGGGGGTSGGLTSLGGGSSSGSSSSSGGASSGGQAGVFVMDLAAQHIDFSSNVSATISGTIGGTGRSIQIQATGTPLSIPFGSAVLNMKDQTGTQTFTTINQYPRLTVVLMPESVNYDTNFDGGSLQVIIEALSETIGGTVSGTFSGTAKNSSTGEIRQITNGRFQAIINIIE